jgi:hypothetical protein
MKKPKSLKVIKILTTRDGAVYLQLQAGGFLLLGCPIGHFDYIRTTF